MKRLEENIGEEVEINLVFHKTPLSVMGKIKDVERFHFIKVKDINIVKPAGLHLADIAKESSIRIPFVWPGYAIQKIKKEEILYEMCLIEDSYNLTNPKKVLELAEIIYGKEIADNFIELKQIMIEGESKGVFKVFYT
jgi:hypothetical protein